MRYVLKQLVDGNVWTSPETFEAAAEQHVRQAVIAGFTPGQSRWAESEDSTRLIYGLDAKGKEARTLNALIRS